MRDYFTESQLGLLRRNICAGLCEDDFQLFVQACERSGLDPFARHIYPMPRTDWSRGRAETRYRAEVSIDGLRAVAERTGKYTGQLGPEWCGPDGEWKDVWTKDEPPTAARVGILREDFKAPVWGKALYAEYIQLENGEPARLWGKMATCMLAKVAEALALRKTFPQQLGGLYSSEEMAQAKHLTGIDVKSPVPISGAYPVSSERASPEHGAHSSPRPVPSELQRFVDAIPAPATNAQAMKFLRDELMNAGGAEGARIFNRLTGRLPRTFPTREACQQARLKCWLDLWDEVERLRSGHEFARAVNQ
jgi:phage recombination protein Bet